MGADRAEPEAHGGLVIRDARPEDVPLLLRMFRELAEYEDLTSELHATDELLHAALFGERPAAEALIARIGAEAAGYAIFYPTFSTFLAIQGIWLEDLYVRPEHRKGGVGKALLTAVAARTHARGGKRLEWSALDWNDLALGFYERLGAQPMREWITHRVVGEQIERLAREFPDAAGG
ncbi:MAG TPA: GNAT family N-acetyltransferase [Solirubrobacteraceae bacterium]|nr:GNAT family N-acetyltransferase [Solirubrobacteraceae bacterium]